jgi:hypothetical protein
VPEGGVRDPLRGRLTDPFGAGGGAGSVRRSALRGGDRNLGAAGTGVAGHQAVGEESAAVGVVLAGARPSGRLLGAIRDGSVTMHDQLAETAPHPSPPHRCRRLIPDGETLCPPIRRGSLWPCIGATGRLLEKISQHLPNSPLARFSGRLSPEVA